MVDSLLADFQALTTRLASEGPAGSIEFLLEQIEPESARYLRLCAIPHQFDEEILEALGPDLDTHHANLLCQEFSKLPIITFNHDGMALHDKARRQLFQQWIERPISPEFGTASERLVEYFDQCAKRPEISECALKLIQVSWVFHYLGADQERGFDEFQKLCRKRRRQFALSDCEQLINLVHEYDNVLSPEHESWLAYHEGKLAADRCQWELADELFHRVLKNETLDPALRIRTYNRMGMIRDEKRDYSGAVEYYQKALELLDTTYDDPRIRYRILHDLGATHRDSNDLEKADELLRQSIKLAEETGDNSGMAVGCNSLGLLQRRLRENYLAIDYFQKSLVHLERCGDKYRPAQVYNNLGISYRELAQWDKSREFYEKSLCITRAVDDKIGQAKTLNNLMMVYGNLKETDRAVSAANEAIQLFLESHDPFNAAWTKRNLGRLYRRLKNRDAAAQALEEAVQTFEDVGDSKEVIATRRDLARVWGKTRSPGFWIAVCAVILFIFIGMFLLVLKL